MRRFNRRIPGFVWSIVVLIYVTSMFTATFFLTSYIYSITHLNLPAVLVHIVNSVLSLFFIGLTISGASKVARSKGWIPEMHIFGSIIEAMQKIAKGDFTVRLDNTFRENEIANVLVRSVNDMALELNKMEKMRQEFISNVSHEIQSPLTSIRGFAQALHNEQLTQAERSRYLDIIETESMRLSKLSDNLLELASLESENVRFEPRPYRLDTQIRKLILVCEPQWMEKKIDMDVCLEEVVITADEDLLSQVWLNMIHNSIKFTPPGGRILIALHRKIDNIEFVISDTGIGISAEDQAHIFERFYKADKSRDRSKGGNGLGLSIVQKIVELHRGTITVESEPGAGTTFIVSLSLS